MQFNSHASNQDIVSEIDSLCDTDSTSYPIAVKTRRVNAALEELVSDIINSDGTWQYDDTNHADLPILTGTLVEGQQSYSYASEFLDVESVEVLDKGGTYRKLIPIDIHELGGLSIDEWIGNTASTTKTGMPAYYDKQGDTIKLYPAPTSTSVTLTNGLKTRVKRTVDLFTTSDTTQEPGLPSTHHIMLAYMAAIPYCMTYKKDRVGLYAQKVAEMKKTLLAFYGRREKDRRKIMSMVQTASHH